MPADSMGSAVSQDTMRGALECGPMTIIGYHLFRSLRTIQLVLVFGITGCWTVSGRVLGEDVVEVAAGDGGGEHRGSGRWRTSERVGMASTERWGSKKGSKKKAMW